jgi:sarcosine oxidase
VTDSTIYDCIVLGFGGVGSQALRHAAMKGWKTLGLDQYGPAHDRGSSHGQSRIIRTAYFEHPNYVPLVARAYEMWDELNKRHRTKPEIKQLLTACGLLQIGRPESEVVQGVLSSAQAHGLTVEEFSSAQVMQRLPIFKVPGDYVGVFEPDAGFLRVELCVAAAIKQAIKQGAEIRSGVQVLGWDKQSTDEIEVKTNQGTIKTRRLIIAAGAWATDHLLGLDLGLSVVRKQQHWFQLDRVDQKLANQFPAFLIEDGSGQQFYGVPEFDHLGMKVGQHTGGDSMDPRDGLDHELDKNELAEVEAFLNAYFNFGRSRLVHHSNCMYTHSQDGHFVIDRHPEHAKVTFAAGLSGHGFKFTPVIGKYLVDLLDGERDPIFDFLKIRP